LVAGQPDQPLDVIRGFGQGRPEDDDLLAMRVAPQADMELRHRYFGVVPKRLISKWSPTSKVLSIEPEGITRAWTIVPVMNKKARMTQSQDTLRGGWPYPDPASAPLVFEVFLQRSFGTA